MKQIYKNITDIDNGGLIEQANLDFSKIMASINDLNTDKRKAAKLVIEIQIKAHEDDDFADVQYKVKATPLENDHCKCMAVNTLSALIDIVKESIMNGIFNEPLMIRISGNTVDVFSGMDRFKVRDHIVQSSPYLPHILFNSYMSVEKFIIQLQTCFAADEALNKDKLLSYVSKLTSEVKVEIEDDGISQKVTTSKGTAVKQNESVVLPPIVRLQPINTYPELSPVETMYLLRVDKDGEVALFEADGNRWEFEAQCRIREYLFMNLKEEIENESVIIVG